jgi:hypothetical protein
METSAVSYKTKKKDIYYSIRMNLKGKEELELEK